jgi:hypothetical protein
MCRTYSESPTASPALILTKTTSLTAGPAPALTKTPSLTDTPRDDLSDNSEEASSVTFSITSSEKTPPEDVLQEVGYYEGGGPGSSCDIEYQVPTVIFPPQEVEFKQIATVYTCGWQPDELVQITVKLPNGDVLLSQQVRARTDHQSTTASFCSVSFDHKVDIDSPLGSYAYSLDGNSGSVHGSFYVKSPTEPRLYVDGSKLTLYAFEPGERIRLFAYEIAGDEWGAIRLPIGSLAGWQGFQVDSSGQLVVLVESEGGYYHYAV